VLNERGKTGARAELQLRRRRVPLKETGRAPFIVAPDQPKSNRHTGTNDDDWPKSYGGYDLRRALLIAAVSLVLLAGASLVTLFNYSQDTGLLRENQSSKIELSRQTRYLQALEDERHALQAQLDLKGTGYNSKIVELESKIMDLEAQIEKLQDQLKRQNYIAVGLTFSSKRELNVDASSVANVVDGMDDAVWDRFHVYFFVFHAESRDFMPTTVECSGGHSIRA